MSGSGSSSISSEGAMVIEGVCMGFGTSGLLMLPVISDDIRLRMLPSLPSDGVRLISLFIDDRLEMLRLFVLLGYFWSLRRVPDSD